MHGVLRFGRPNEYCQGVGTIAEWMSEKYQQTKFREQTFADHRGEREGSSNSLYSGDRPVVFSASEQKVGRGQVSQRSRDDSVRQMANSEMSTGEGLRVRYVA